MMMKILWRRHWWEACLFVLVSLGLSGLVWSRSGDRFVQGLVWLEVASLVWLVTRVGLTRAGFGTFGGWKAKPVGRGWYILSEALFLILPISGAALMRMTVVGEVLHPSSEGWREVTEAGGILLGGLFGVFVFCKLVGWGWEWDDPRSRPNLAWGLVITMVVISLVPIAVWGKGRVSHTGSSFVVMSPLSMEGVEDWQWLRPSLSSFVEVEDVRVEKLSLREGIMIDRDGLRLEITRVGVRDEEVVVEWKASRSAGFSEELPVWVGVMISYGGRHYGTTEMGRREEDDLRVPLLDLRQAFYSCRVLSPLALPENELSSEELLEEAEFWVTMGKPKSSREQSGRDRELPENGEEVFRWSLGGTFEGWDLDRTREELDERGAEVMDDVLRAAPWSEKGWQNLVKPYLLKYGRNEDRARLLALLESHPWVGDFFVEKEWGNIAEPVVRKHLAEGKTLGKRSVIYLAELGEEEMGDDLVNQLLRMKGDHDAVVTAVKGHPGVDWDEVRREAWLRVATGFGSHHLWVRWGAEMGDKEALRRLLVEANRGKKWEREALEGWFGKEGEVLERLRQNWERVRFAKAKWEIEVSGSL